MCHWKVKQAVVGGECRRAWTRAQIALGSAYSTSGRPRSRSQRLGDGEAGIEGHEIPPAEAAAADARRARLAGDAGDVASSAPRLNCTITWSAT